MNRKHLSVSVSSTMKGLVTGRIEAQDVKDGYFCWPQQREGPLLSWRREVVEFHPEGPRQALIDSIERCHRHAGDEAAMDAITAIRVVLDAAFEARETGRMVWLSSESEVIGSDYETVWNMMKPHMTDPSNSIEEAFETLGIDIVGQREFSQLFQAYGVQAEFFNGYVAGQATWQK